MKYIKLESLFPLHLMYMYIVASRRLVQTLLSSHVGKQFIISDDVGITRDVKWCKYCMRGYVTFKKHSVDNSICNGYGYAIAESGVVFLFSRTIVRQFHFAVTHPVFVNHYISSTKDICKLRIMLQRDKIICLFDVDGTLTAPMKVSFVIVTYGFLHCVIC
jgi:hypothetical protein